MSTERQNQITAATEGCAAADGLRADVARKMIDRGFATGHGDTVEELLNDLWWQVDDQRNHWRNRYQSLIHACEKLPPCSGKVSAEHRRVCVRCRIRALLHLHQNELSSATRHDGER